MYWVRDHLGDWVNLAQCFSLTLEPAQRPDGVSLYQLRASSGGTIYAVLVEAPEEEAVLQARDALMAQLDAVCGSVPAREASLLSSSGATLAKMPSAAKSEP